MSFIFTKSFKQLRINHIKIGAQSRKLHQLRPIPAEIKNHEFLFPKTQMKFIEQERESLVTKLNNAVNGTKYEYDNLFQTILKSASDPEDSHIFNYASQLWNIGFYIENISSKKTLIREDLRNKIVSSFGSIENFQEEFLAASESVFSNGWTWLVEDGDGSLRIVNTLNSGTPLIPGRMQSLEGMDFATGQEYRKTLSVPFTLDAEKPRGTYLPLLGLNLWQSAYILDHGSNVLQYANNFLAYADWDKVQYRLFRTVY